MEISLNSPEQISLDDFVSDQMRNPTFLRCPNDILFIIFTYLEGYTTEYKNLCLACKKFNMIIKERFFFKIQIEYEIKGFDHIGWCSGADVDSSELENSDESEDDSSKQQENYKIENSYAVENKLSYLPFSDFNNGVLKEDLLVTLEQTHDGCTSGGSGYCSGMYQKYIPMSCTIIKYFPLETSLEVDSQEYDFYMRNILELHRGMKKICLSIDDSSEDLDSDDNSKDQDHKYPTLCIGNFRRTNSHNMEWIGNIKNTEEIYQKAKKYATNKIIRLLR